MKYFIQYIKNLNHLSSIIFIFFEKNYIISFIKKYFYNYIKYNVNYFNNTK